MQLVGKLIIAPPTVRGNFWQKTVIFVSKNHKDGSIGLVLNKKSKLSIREFSKKCGYELDIDGYIYIGGPINNTALSLIHSPDWACRNTFKVNDKFSISSSADIMRRFAQGDIPAYWRLAMGLCVWSADQLNAEVAGTLPYNSEQSWLVTTPNLELVFDNDSSDQWVLAIEQASAEFAHTILD